MKTTIQNFKKGNLITKVFFLIATVAIFSSCSKEGPAGPAGKDGNANVIASPWSSGITFTGSGSTYTSSIAATGITQAILDNGTVLVYVRDNNTQVYPLNYVSPTGATIRYDYRIGTINFTASYNPSGLSCRYVIIPSSTAGKGVNLKEMSYLEVCNYLKIQP